MCQTRETCGKGTGRKVKRLRGYHGEKNSPKVVEVFEPVSGPVSLSVRDRIVHVSGVTV